MVLIWSHSINDAIYGESSTLFGSLAKLQTIREYDTGTKSTIAPMVPINAITAAITRSKCLP